MRLLASLQRPARPTAPRLLLLLVSLLLAAVLLPTPARAVLDRADAREILKINEPWTGDLDGMIQRRFIRALVPYSKTNYFLEGGRQRGVTYELLNEFEKRLNKELGKKRLKVHVIIIPTSRENILDKLEQGYGDIVCASLTVTESRERKVDFSNPFADKVEELVITGPGAPELHSLEDLSGKEIFIRKDSSYAESIATLNKHLKAKKLAPAKIRPADPNLETEDILEMVHAGLAKITVADNYLAQIWSDVFTDLTVHKDLALRTDGRIAWAVRKDSPELIAAINGFAKVAKRGTLLGNVLFKRYYVSNTWLKNAYAPDDIKRFQSTVDLFKNYAGQYGFDWLMIAALAYQESGLDQSLVSAAGAVGVMQILPSTAQNPPVQVTPVTELEKNVHAGVKYLHWLYTTYYADEPIDPLDKILFTFASYNAGPARVRQLRAKTSELGLDPNVWFDNVEVAAAKVVGQETVQYVSNIYKYYIAYVEITNQMEQRKELKK